MASSSLSVNAVPEFPQLKENVWHIDRDQPSATLLTTNGSFEVPTDAALTFLAMRSFCTGSHSIASIAERSGVPVSDVNLILNALQGAGLIYSDVIATSAPSLSEVRETLSHTCALWSNELRLTYIGNAFVEGRLPLSTLIGWQIEMFHYIRDFPEAIAHAAEFADGELKQKLIRYADEERGHEEYILRTLERLGMSRVEVLSSIPLLSTRLIGFLMRELFSIDPASVFLVAAVLEAREFAEEEIDVIKRKFTEHYGIADDAFDPYFQHQKIDFELGHADLLERHTALFTCRDRCTLDQLVNKLHDIKHAFDLQGLEIENYFNELNGKYVPRQPIKYEDLVFTPG